jgi:uncharacterized protein (TIGR03435 family)
LAIRIVSAQPRPAYEAASIRLNESADSHSGTDGYQGRIMFENQPLHRLIEMAYGVTPAQVSGPDWLNTLHFDITATYPPDSKSADRAVMLRTLLEDRFKLAMHRERKEMSGYALVMAKNGFQLKPTQPGENSTQHSGGAVQALKATNTTIATLAGLLSRYLGQVVVDKTGIDGVYDFELHWTRNDAVADDAKADAPPPIYTALQETLGLRLQAQKVPVEIVVVDHIERTPTEN